VFDQNKKSVISTIFIKHTIDARIANKRRYDSLKKDTEKVLIFYSCFYYGNCSGIKKQTGVLERAVGRALCATMDLPVRQRRTLRRCGRSRILRDNGSVRAQNAHATARVEI
jgi:hypothetical protein